MPYVKDSKGKLKYVNPNKRSSSSSSSSSSKQAEINKLVKQGVDKISATNYVNNTYKKTGSYDTTDPSYNWTGTVVETGADNKQVLKLFDLNK